MQLGDFKNYLAFPGTFGIILAVLFLFAACGPKTELKEKKDTNVLEEHAAKAPTALSEEENILEIERLIDITFDEPQKVVVQPDSFMNLISVLPQTALGKESYAWLLLNVAYVLREHGAVLPSIRFYERAFDYCTSQNLKEPDLVLYIAKPLANLYTRIGDVEKSISLHEKAIEITTNNKEVNYLPSLYSNLSIAYQQHGDYDRVLKVARKGISFAQTESLPSALLFGVLANAYLETNEIDSALFYNAKALDIFQKHRLKDDTLIWYGASLKLESDLAKAQNNNSKALRTINKAIQLTNAYFSDSKQREKAKYLIARGELNQEVDLRSALTDFQSASYLLETDTETEYVSDYTYTHALRGLAKSYSTINIDSALYYYARTIENDYRTQQLIVSKASNYKNSEWNRGILTEYLELLWKVYQEEPESLKKQSLALQVFWAIELSKGRQIQREITRSRKWEDLEAETDADELRMELQMLKQKLLATTNVKKREDLQKKIEELDFEFKLSEKYFEQTFLMIDFEEFKKYLLEESKAKTLISYLIQEEGRSYVVSINDANTTIETLRAKDFENLKLNAFIDTYFGDTPYAFENNPDEYTNKARNIANALLPTGNSMKSEVVLSPDGILFKLPMDALIREGKFIAESTTLSSTYTFLLNFLNQDLEEFHSDVLFYARSKHTDGFRDLEFVQNEKEAIAGRFEGAVFEEENATVQSFVANLHKPDLFHLATHAVSDQEPYLVFENRLTLDGLTMLAMQSPLVILSACESASGELIKAEGLESLNKAFISKGAKGVIAAQWPVNDQSTAQLMALFYKELYRLDSPVKALNSAKRIFIKEKGAIYKNPWYWASMNYMGVDSEIKIKKKTGNWVYGVIGLSMFLILFLLYKHSLKLSA